MYSNRQQANSATEYWTTSVMAFFVSSHSRGRHVLDFMLDQINFIPKCDNKLATLSIQMDGYTKNIIHVKLKIHQS